MFLAVRQFHLTDSFKYWLVAQKIFPFLVVFVNGLLTDFVSAISPAAYPHASLNIQKFIHSCRCGSTKFNFRGIIRENCFKGGVSYEHAREKDPLQRGADSFTEIDSFSDFKRTDPFYG